MRPALRRSPSPASSNFEFLPARSATSLAPARRSECLSRRNWASGSRFELRRRAAPRELDRTLGLSVQDRWESLQSGVLIGRRQENRSRNARRVSAGGWPTCGGIHSPGYALFGKTSVRHPFRHGYGHLSGFLRNGHPHLKEKVLSLITEFLIWVAVFGVGFSAYAFLEILRSRHRPAKTSTREPEKGR